ncbi:pyridoxal phosphate-dependent aminotransferase [Fusibacter paucivorans]|uniref:cysteine-S-conjugate beta-lyase n=1 Tax=Fusibacter paucivorans TaxID=76009 RepID=A0ABS5PMN3_9FIRM|nr:MalY/PatB family protein [Fusibacter paucivorans]MBS7526323.1 pyridoxal phosphate-dependent aminotransferase [Fusibacter paucivorans]
MQYQFDKIIDRKNTNSVKWEPNVLKTMFGDEEMLPMWVADMDFKCPDPVVEALVKRAEHGIYGYADIDESYYEAIVDWNARRNNWQLDKSWIVFTPGVVPAVNYLVQTFCKTGDKVIIQNPVYYPFSMAINNNGAGIVLNPLKEEAGDYVMDYEDLEAKVKDPRVRMLILCSPHNPVGRVWRKEELERLGEICLANDVLVVADEIHSDLIMSGHQHTPFASISESFANNSITCVAPSKTFNLAGLQVSNIIIPNDKLRKEYQVTLENNAIRHPNTFGIVALEAAYTKGEPWLEAVLAYIEGNMDFIKKFVDERLPGVTFKKPEGTYLAWLDFRGLNMDQSSLEKWMQRDLKLALDEGYIFGSGGEGFERINAACPRSLIEEALGRIERGIKALNSK